jgi:uncharacterized membrane protein YhaH (DUF805 family)
LLSALFLSCVTSAFITASIGAKRLHDRNKSGWWMVIFQFGPTALLLTSKLAMHTVGELVTVNVIANVGSIVLGIWALIEFGFLRGTPGPNRFGPDPIARMTSTPISTQPGLA